MPMKLTIDYESPALDIMEIETEQSCFILSSEEGDGSGTGGDWPPIQWI